MGGDKFTLLTVDEDVLYGKGKEGSSRFIVIRIWFKMGENFQPASQFLGNCVEVLTLTDFVLKVFLIDWIKNRKSKKAFIVGIGCNDLSSTSSQVAESVYQIYEYMMKNNYWMFNVGLS